MKLLQRYTTCRMTQVFTNRSGWCAETHRSMWLIKKVQILSNIYQVFLCHFNKWPLKNMDYDEQAIELYFQYLMNCWELSTRKCFKVTPVSQRDYRMQADIASVKMHHSVNMKWCTFSRERKRRKWEREREQQSKIQDKSVGAASRLF